MGLLDDQVAFLSARRRQCYGKAVKMAEVSSKNTSTPWQKSVLSSPARSGNDSRSGQSSCQRFLPNPFTPSLCQECFRNKTHHSQDALATSRAARKVCKCGYLFVAPSDYDSTNPNHRSRKWQHRFFVLYDDGELTFALDDNTDTLPQGIIDMQQVTEVKDASAVTGHEFSLQLQTADQDYFVRANSKEEIRWWYDVLVMYPRSHRFTKQQRSLPQKRSRTLPNNALSDQQLKALRIDTEAPAPSVQPKIALDRVQSCACPASQSLHTKETVAPLGSLPIRASMSSGGGDANVAEEEGLQTEVVMVRERRQPTQQSAVQARSEEIFKKPVVRDISRPLRTSVGQSRSGRSLTLDSVHIVPPKPIDTVFLLTKSEEKDRNMHDSGIAAEGGLLGPGHNTDSFTDTELSTDSEDAGSVKGKKKTEERFTLAGLSHRDIEDLKQLQKIMSKKPSGASLSGSLSSRSSSCSSASAAALYGRLPASRNQPVSSLAMKENDRKSVKKETAHRPRSPPVTRNALSKAKERSRITTRSKSPVQSKATERGSQVALVIDGHIRYEEVAGSPKDSPPRPAFLARESQLTGAANEPLDLSPNLPAVEERLTRLRKEYLGDRLFSPFASVALQGKEMKRYSDQSTQISLDVRHYETMLSNLEKRLLDREQLLRDTVQRNDSNKRDHTIVVQDLNKTIQTLKDQVLQCRREQDLLLKNLELSRTLTDKYEKRIHFLLDEMNKVKKEEDEEAASLREKLQEATSEKRQLESQLSERDSKFTQLNGAYAEATVQKDAMVSSARQEVMLLRRQLNQTEDLLKTALQKDVDDSDFLTRNLIQSSPSRLDDHSSPFCANDDLQQIAGKFLRALKEIKALRKENTALNDQISEMNLEFADVREKLQSLESHRGRAEKEEEHQHEECHATIEALHAEISSLQNRLHVQEKRHAAELSSREQLLKSVVADLTKALPGHTDASRASDTDNERCQCRVRLEEMDGLYQSSITALEKNHVEALKEMRRAYTEEMVLLEQRKDQELADETNATRAALDAIRKSYQENLVLERSRLAESSPVIQSTSFSPYSDTQQAVHEALEGLRQKVAAEMSSKDQLRRSQEQLSQIVERCQKRLSLLQHDSSSSEEPLL